MSDEPLNIEPAKFDRITQIKCWQLTEDQDVARFLETLEVSGLDIRAVIHRADLEVYEVFFGAGAEQDLDEADQALHTLGDWGCDA